MSGAGYVNKRQVPFTQLANAMLRDKLLSLKAKGLLSMMLSFPDGWQYYMKHLEEQSSDGREAHQNAMKDLITAGYVVRTAAADPGTGRLNGWTYEVSDERESRQAGKPSDGKPATINNYSKKTDYKKTLKDGAENRSASENPAIQTTPSREETGTAQQGESGKEATSLDTVPGAAVLVIPGALAALPGFAEAWGEWVSYRRERRLTCAAVVLRGQLSRLGKNADPVGMLTFSRENGYQGVFAPNAKGKPQTTEEANSRAAQRASDIYTMLQEETNAVF